MRNVEHLMIVEVKVSREVLRAPQRDSLSVFNGLLSEFIPIDGSPIAVKSRPGFIRPGDKKVVWHGIHICRVPFDYSPDGPFFWNNAAIYPSDLVAVLNFENDALAPVRRLDIERRHKRTREVSDCMQQQVLFVI